MLLAPLAVFLLFQPGGAQDAVGRFMRLRGEIVSPAYEGWWQNEDGSFTLFFGYMNSNWEQEFNVPIGPLNYFTVTEAGGLDDLDHVGCVTCAPGVLLDQDGVGRVRHRGAGEDADRLAGAKLAAVAAARRRLAGHLEPGADDGVRRAHRVAVHRRGGEGGLVAGGDGVRRQHPPGSLGQWDFLGADRFDQPEDARQRVGDGEQHQSASYSPDLPPALWVTRMSVMRMARSAALHMS